MAEQDALNTGSESGEKPSTHRSKGMTAIIASMFLLLFILVVFSTIQQYNRTDISEILAGSGAGDNGEENEPEKRTSLRGVVQQLREEVQQGNAQEPKTEKKTPDQLLDEYAQNQLPVNATAAEREQELKIKRQEHEERLLIAARLSEISSGASQSQSGTGSDGRAVGSGRGRSNSSDPRVEALRDQLNRSRANLNSGGTSLSSSPDIPSFTDFPSDTASLGESRGNSNMGVGYEDAGQNPDGYLIPIGTIIDGMLAQELNSDHGGNFSGVVRHNVYDLAYENILIPQGSRFKGRIEQFNGPNAAINSLMAIAIENIIRPDGSTIYLDDLTGLNLKGSGGIDSNTDNHIFAQVMGTVAYATIGVAPSIVFDGDTDSTSDQARQDVLESVSEQTQGLTNKYLSLVPTQTTPFGTPFKVILDSPLKVSSYKKLNERNFGGL